MSIQRIGFLAAALMTLVAGYADAAGPIGLRRTDIPQSQNFYYEGADELGSKAYPAPLPVPRWVGHTYYTYQPFEPHHHMWMHYDVTRRYGTAAVGGADACDPAARRFQLRPTTTTRAFYW